jgi:large exoprotein involved in heme utilization and adhesion
MGNAGDIIIDAGDRLLIRDGGVTTQAEQADGGDIHVNAGHLVHLVESEITTSVDGGPDTIGGNINIDPEYVILDNSRIYANAFEGRGGKIGIVSDVCLVNPYSVVDASSALGIDGEVNILAPVSEISGTLTPLQKDFRSAIALLREPCLTRIRGGGYSSFFIIGRDGLPLEPGGLLPSPLF